MTAPAHHCAGVCGPDTACGRTGLPAGIAAPAPAMSVESAGMQGPRPMQKSGSGGARRRISCKDCRLIEPEPGFWVSGYCPSCRKARGIQPNTLGRPRTRLRFTGTCRHCGTPIEWLATDSRKTKQFCSKRCHLAYQLERRRKLPKAEELTRLYVKDRLSTPKIAALFGTDAHTVRTALLKAGITLRKKTTSITCQHPGCMARVQKILHKGNGSLYGTLCARHRWEHRKDVARRYRKAHGEGIRGGEEN